jgi:hypothetical protein
MEVDLAEQRGRLPAAAGVPALDQPEQRRPASLEQLRIPEVRVATRNKMVGADHGEAHGVQVAIRDPAGIAIPDDEEAGVGRSMQRTIPRVDPEAVDMDEAGVLGGRPRRVGLSSATAALGQCDQQGHPKCRGDAPDNSRR